ncbi:MAG TPA: RNA methyltransferase, partial [Abditibacteriaceae bacterium]
MSSIVISSRQHPLCKLVRSLHNGRDRRRQRLFVVEGGNGVTAALGARWPLQRLLAAPEDLEDGWGEVAATAGVDIQPVTPEILQYLCDAQTSPGVLAIAHLPEAQTLAEIAPPGLTLVLDSIGDPGNVGTLIRTADAVAASAIVATQNSADPFAPKVVRASAGSLFHMNMAPQSTPDLLIEEFSALRIPIVVAVAHQGEDCFSYRWPRRCALVLGHETRGISPELEEVATARVTIPMVGRAESLNVASAGAV